MPRAKSTRATKDTPEVKKTTTRRKAKKTAAAPEETEEDAPKPKRRASRRKAGTTAAPAKKAAAKKEKKESTRQPMETMYVDQADIGSIWDNIVGGKDARVAINGDNRSPRGKRQIAAVDFVKSKGRRKVTATNVIEHLEEDGTTSGPYASWVVATCLNTGILDVA